MRKKSILCCLVALILFSMFVFTSCENYSDESIAKEKQGQLLEAIKSKNHNAIESLFASNTIKDQGDISEKIDKLLSYFEGEYISHIAGGPMVVNDKHDGKSYKYYHMSCHIVTTETKYRIALKWYIEDTFDATNIGIWALYIFSEKDEPTAQHEFLPGIHVGEI